MDINIKSLKTVSSVEDYRQKINEECDNRICTIKNALKANELSNKRFGYIKECFETISPELFKTNDGKKIMKKYTNTIKESKELSFMHELCESIRKTNKNSDINFFINGIIEHKKNFNSKKINEDVKKLGRVLAEGYLYVSGKNKVLLPEENTKLYEALDFIAETDYSLKNLPDYSAAVKVIEECVENNDNVVNKATNKSLDQIASELMENFNKKYSGNLNEEEISILKEIASSDNRETVFNKYKDLCMESIKAAKSDFENNGDKNSTKRLENIMEQVSNKQFNLTSVGEDICNLIELSKVLKS